MILSDQLVVVTGASKGIGLATTKALLVKGAAVAAWSRSEIVIDHPKLKKYKVDVRETRAVRAAYDSVVTDFKRDVSVLINNAGLGYEGSFDDLSEENWRDMFQTNVDAIFYATKMVLPSMKQNGRGHIINISSVAGQTGIPGMVGYCATKFAVRGLSNALFKEVKKFGVKVTCIYPGSVKTNFFDDIASVEASDDMLMPEDIASTIVHCLESPDNSNHLDIEVRPLRGRG